MSLVADGVNRKIFILMRNMLAVYYVRLQWKSHGKNTVNGRYSVTDKCSETYVAYPMKISNKIFRANCGLEGRFLIAAIGNSDKY